MLLVGLVPLPFRIPARSPQDLRCMPNSPYVREETGEPGEKPPRQLTTVERKPGLVAEAGVEPGFEPSDSGV